MPGSPMRGRLPMTDTARAYVATAAAGVLGSAVFLVLGFTTVGGGPHLDARAPFADPIEYFGLVYLAAWPIYCATYLLHTWWSYRRLAPDVLRVAARRDVRANRGLVTRLLGEGGAASSSITVSVTAVLVTVLVTRGGLLQGEPVLLALAFLTVGGSWAVLVAAFTLAYLRLNETSAAPDGGAHLEIASPRPYRADDYLTVALLASTMAATISVSPRSRAGWRLLRTNVVIAFVFNSVIIAMVVSLLIGGLTS